MSSDQNLKTNTNEPSIESRQINLVASYSVDPVVSCREEGDDGAILFNPDTDNSILINPTGLMVWNYLQKPRKIGDISRFMKENLTNAPDDAEIQSDIVEFISDLSPEFIREDDSIV